MFWEMLFSCPLLWSAFEWFFCDILLSGNVCFHTLGFWSCVQWQEHKLQSFQIFNNWMRKIIINSKNNFTIFVFKLFIEFLYPLMSKETVHPTFHLRPITTGKAFDVFKALGFADLPTANIGNFSPAALVAAIPVNLTLLCLLPLHFSPCMCKVFLGSPW